MKTLHSKTGHRNPWGFTLIELLVAMTVIGILVGMLAFGVQKALTRAREFSVQTEMNNLEVAIEKFQIEFGFYPPSFKFMTAERFQTYINRIAPNNVEGSGAPGSRPIDAWWNQIGQKLVIAANSDPLSGNFMNETPGADLVFWLSGLSSNKQFPLTNPNVGPNPAHNYFPGGDGVERQVFFEFDNSRILFNAMDDRVATYVQPAGRNVPYLYRDAGVNYLPSMPDDMASDDGAYLNAKFEDLSGMVRPVELDDVVDAAVHLGGTNPNNRTPLESQMIFKRIYPNPESFQLISFGLDGKPGGPTTGIVPSPPNPNVVTKAGPEGADNMVNFGSTGPGRLENIILDEN